MVQQKRKASDDGEGGEEPRKCPYASRDMSLSTLPSSTNCNSPSGPPVLSTKGTNSCDTSGSRVKQETECEVKSESEETGEVEDDVTVDVDESQALREFDVLDEEDYDQDSDNQSEESFDSDVPDEEIEAMLEEGMMDIESTRLSLSLVIYIISWLVPFFIPGFCDDSLV
jgi:hypothetical protein